MPNGTPTSQTSQVLIRAPASPVLNPRKGRVAPTPRVTPFKPTGARGEPGAIPQRTTQMAMRQAIKAKRAQWAALPLRQQWADIDFMRAHLKEAGLRVNASNEPATVERMKALLRAVGVHSPEIQESVGMPLARFLETNPRMPLWAALALVLESTGRFTPADGGAR